MQDFKIGKFLVNNSSPAIIIAEAAVEHLGSIHAAKRMADAALECGADIIKYQMHLPEHEMLEGQIKFWGGSLDEILDKYNLSIDDHVELINYCSKIGIQYLCTPFCKEAVKVLNSIGVDGYKTGSGELNNFPMMKEIANTKKPVIVSTGMSTESEISATVKFLKNEGVNFLITNCTSIYPSPYNTINLKYISTMREKFDVHIGHSDHSQSIWTAIAAIPFGAKVIEKHFTLSKALKGPDYEVSLEPINFKLMVDGIRAVEAAIGTGEKEIFNDEVNVRKWAHHSIVTTKPIKKGEILSLDNVSVKRPGGGIPSSLLSDVLGKVAAKDIEINYQLKMSDLI